MGVHAGVVTLTGFVSSYSEKLAAEYGGKVVLGGKVHAGFERDIAERAAWSAPGVTEVQDQIQIGT